MNARSDGNDRSAQWDETETTTTTSTKKSREKVVDIHIYCINKLICVFVKTFSLHLKSTNTEHQTNPEIYYISLFLRHILPLVCPRWVVFRFGIYVRQTMLIAHVAGRATSTYPVSSAHISHLGHVCVCASEWFWQAFGGTVSELIW